MIARLYQLSFTIMIDYYVCHPQTLNDTCSYLMIFCRNDAMCSRSFFYFLLFSFSASLSSLDHCRNVNTISSFRYFHAYFWQPRFQCFLKSVFLLFLFLLIFSFSASLSSKYSSKFGFLLHRTIGFPLISRSAAILAKKGCIQPVFGKTTDRKTIMDYHSRDQTEKKYPQLSCRI